MAMIRVCDHCKKPNAGATPFRIDVIPDGKSKRSADKLAKQFLLECGFDGDYCLMCLPLLHRGLEAFMRQFHKEKPKAEKPDIQQTNP